MTYRANRGARSSRVAWLPPAAYIDGSAAVSTGRLMAVTPTKRAGDRVEVGYERTGSCASVTMTLAARQSATP